MSNQQEREDEERYAEFLRGKSFAESVVWDAIEATKAAMENAGLGPQGRDVAKLTVELFISVWREHTTED